MKIYVVSTYWKRLSDTVVITVCTGLVCLQSIPAVMTVCTGLLSLQYIPVVITVVLGVYTCCD